jgi:putative ABC transport system permease protein
MSTRRRPGEDFDREIRAHIEIETQRLIDEGAPPAEARAAACKTFGNVTRARERFYEAGRRLWLDHLWQDVRCAARNIRRYPIAAAVAIISLAGGIGATTVTLTIREMVFRKPPPLYLEPRQISRVQVGSPDRPIMPIGSYVPAALYSIWNDTLGMPIAAARPQRGAREIRTADRTETVPVRQVTPELFSILGVAPALGETLSASGVGRTGPQAMLSHRLWQQLFDGRADALGRVVWIENQAYTVVGVLPERFWFSEMNSPVWTVLDRRALAPDDPLEVIVRRPAGMTPAMLQTRLSGGGGIDQYTRTLPAAQRQLRLKVSGIEGTPLGAQVSIVLPYVLGTSVLLTLLIACANVAILMIAQWTAREHEIAIRASIGASRARIVRALLTESVLVAAAGGVVGVAVTFVLRGWILHRGAADVGFYDLSIDTGVLVQTAVITLLTGIVAGVAPALYETRRLHTNPLRAIASSDRVRQRWRHALVILEITVTVALLVETGAMIDGYERTQTAAMGFATRPLMSAAVEHPRGVPADQVLDVLNGLPGVASAAAATSVPYSGTDRQARVGTDATGSNAVVAEQGAVSAGFFAALGVPLRAGRMFSNQDSLVTRTAIANESLARRLLRGRDAIGSRVWIGDTPYEIVGIVADYANTPLQVEKMEPKIFLPLSPASRDRKRLLFLIRAEGDPSALVQAVRTKVQAAVQGTTVASAFTFDQIIRVIGQEILIGTAPLFPLIAVGTLLTTAGIYGVLAFAITRRSRELAVRMAIGASGRDIVRLVTAHMAGLVAAGTVLGIGLMFILSRIVRAAGGGGSLFDPREVVFLWPLLIVIAIGAIATWVPSRRALRINPAALLRST